MSDLVCVNICDEQFLLHHERAAYWPRKKTLFISDIHFGKEQTFQRSGIAIPVGSSLRDLGRLEELVASINPGRLIILGDLVHSLPDGEETWLYRFNQWIDSRPASSTTVITGNHDKCGTENLVHRGVQWHSQMKLGPFILNHQPVTGSQRHVLCGHLHPVVNLSDGGSDRVRLPVFWCGQNQTVLPAFGSFVGGAAVQPVANDQLWAAGPDGVIDISAAVHRRGTRSSLYQTSKEREN